MLDVSVKSIAVPNPLLALERFFGFKSFLPQQEEIVKAILNGENVLGILATSAGKSLCFQLPALMQESGVTIVISPMVSLMNDQVINLRRNTLNPDIAVRVHSYQTDEESSAEWAKVISGKARLLYLSPETLGSKATLEKLTHIEINSAVVDEAHCATIWGHDFRPNYLEVPKVLKRLGVSQISAFTATAPFALAQEIVKDLGIPEAKIVLGDINRPNLNLEVSTFIWRHERDAALIKRVLSIAEKQEKVVIYCSTIKDVFRIKQLLIENAVVSATYHGQLDREERLKVETAFRNNQVKVLVATKAFGMGIDNPNIRHVIHASLPSCIEDYYQEIGRAGRDGLPANCNLMFCKSDYLQWTQRHIAGKISIDFVKHIYERLVRKVPSEAWLTDGPYQASVNRTHFLTHVTGMDPDYQEKATIAVGLLSEFGVIDWGHTKISFKDKPEDYQLNGFPITTEIVLQRFGVKMDNLDIMYYYATQPNRTEIITEHFVTGTVLKRAKQNKLVVEITVPTETKELLLSAIANNTLKVSTIDGYLSGFWKKLSHEVIQHFARYDISEYDTVLGVLEQEGLISRFEVNQIEYWVITDLGQAELAKNEDLDCSLETYAELKEARHNPSAKRIFQHAIANFVSEETEDLPDEDWKHFYPTFHAHKFEILGVTRTGLQLVTDYHGHKLSILKSSQEIANKLTEEFLSNILPNRL